MLRHPDLDQVLLKDILGDLAVANPITIHQDRSLTDALQVRIERKRGNCFSFLFS